MEEAVINGFHIYHGFLSGYMSVLDKKSEMNSINVFPVADGDTGNNIARTILSTIKGTPSMKSVDAMLKLIADRSLEGARGNSGMILSQFITGFYKAGKGKEKLSIKEFGENSRQAVEFAYAAMAEPREGTILTVLRVWADTIHRESQKDHSIKKILSLGFHAAREALQNTTEQLKILKQNRVVDAGALGVVSFLEGVEKLHLKGPVSYSLRKEFKQGKFLESWKHTEVAHGKATAITFRYCTELLLESPSATAENLRVELKGVGDSLIVGQGDNRIRIHIHTDDPQGLTTRLNSKGKIIQQKVDDMVRQNQVVNERKADIAVVTDSIADIPLNILDELQIHVIPLNLMWGDREYLDRLTISPEEFYRQQAFRNDFPSSSLPDITRITENFSYLKEYYDGILVLPVSNALSGTCQQMMQAAQAFNEVSRIVSVIDTKLNSAAQGLLVMETAREAMKGASLADLEKFASDLRERVKIYVSLNTFKFMVKGGRVSPLTGSIAAALNMKPIVTLDENGKGVAKEKAFSMRGLLKKITDILKVTVNTSGIEKFCVVHALAPAKAEEFARLVEGIIGIPVEYITSISPIVGMHSGKGAVAIGLIEGKMAGGKTILQNTPT